jgi:hypothetical protein
MSIKKQIKKMSEPITIGYNQTEKTYVVSNQSKTTIFENESLKKAIRDYKSHVSVETKVETVEVKPSGKKAGRKSTKNS